MADLQTQVSTLRQQPSKNIEPLPAIAHPEPYGIDLKQLRDPFATMMNVKAARPGESGALAAYELGALKMAGTITQGQNRWGLVVAPDGKLYRVRVGDELGTHGGKVNTINDGLIELDENIPDVNGALREHKNVLTLTGSDEKKP